MTQLKTLNQLVHDNSGEVQYSDLKEEAIKWIKALERSEEVCDYKHPDWLDYDYQEEQVIKFIEHFFNITEDDLK